LYKASVLRFKFVKFIIIEYILADLRLIRQEIGFLKEKHEITMKELDHEMKKSANGSKSSSDSQKKQKRMKRPARLLPSQLLFDRDNDDDDDRTTKTASNP